MNASTHPGIDQSSLSSSNLSEPLQTDWDADSDLQGLLDSAPISIHWVNADGIITWANRTELEMLGYTRAEYIGHHIAKFHIDQEVIANILCALTSGQALQSKQARLRHRDGSTRIGAIDSNGLWKNGKFIHTRCFTRDVTEQVAMEQKRLELNEGFKEQARIIHALYRLTDQLHRAVSLEDIYSAALLAIQDALRCDRSAILLCDESRWMRFAGWRGGLSDSYRAFVEGHCPWRQDDINPQPVSIDLVASSDLDPALKAIVVGEGIQALAFIPLVTNEKLIGKFMAYFDSPHMFDKNDVELSLSIARQLAFGIEHWRAEEALRENQRQFKEMIDALPAAIYRTDAEGRVTYFNPAAVEFSGRVPELGTDRWCVTWKLYHSDGRSLPHDECPMAVSLKEGRSIRGIEAIVERPDGTRRWFTPFPTPFKDSNGHVVGAINMLLDITERKDAEQTLRDHAKQLALVTDIAPVFIAYCDVDARYRFVNVPYAARFGLQPKELNGRHIAEVIGHEAYESIRPYVDLVLSGERVEFDLSIRQLFNDEKYVHCSYAPELASDGRVIGWVAAIADITERRRFEEALRTSEEKLKETDRRKDEFIAMLSHELRNPLAPIANAVHLLHRESNQSAVFQQARAIIERQTAKLARLVDDLLEVSRITTGRIQLQMERIVIGGIIERAVETVRPLIEQHRHQLVVALPSDSIWINADGTRLEQVFINLLTNAAKYTDDGGLIELAVQLDEGEILVSIKDSGIGISPELLPRIFELFMQSERTLDRSQGGLGIGLALVQRLVSMHGGSVIATSRVNVGSEFIVRLPVAAVPDVIDNIKPMPINKLQKTALRILVVDDNIDAAQSLAILIEAFGHSAWTANDGEAGLAAVMRHKPHIVILDIGLPKLDGYSVASQLRASVGADLMLVAITGYGQVTDRNRALEAGFNHHLIKPVDFSIVERIIHEQVDFLQMQVRGRNA